MANSFKTKSGFVTLYWVMSILLIAVGLVTLLMASQTGSSTGGGGIGIGVLMMIVAGWSTRTPLLTLHDDHFDMKVALAAPRKKVLYADIDRLDTSHAKRITVHARGKKVVVPLTMFSSDDQGAIRSRLVKLVGKKKGKE